ncbi:hypothetical protein DYB37_006052 [Aphanomyces astaci]|uniref:BPL/LPL catalytic domain-containing protein n=1 Tax=Aphanomyces astaci TaxID=112090 RepID=A0A397CZU1_APHAT|nr:hypothetical protein DYB25_004460 [Aphanomyces astaci]RHY08502.1 hypothetical protein DYB36_005341 [Aphanomyces astaci]RHY52540.1 hypothetical protein DYB38_008163 [Aphanomyces astaci]RHY80106.1 hypothetical protein DYB26_004955 [Aphanomyces astaci]RHY90020.1 hypothetical protein DYB35_005478 [Aphanomyces astaci]
MAASSVLPKLRLLRLQGIPIYDQLKLEEALFRVDPDNWFIWNERTKTTNIVMGISGKPERLLDVDAVVRYHHGRIRHHSALPHVKPFPRDIMEWSSTFYTPLFRSLLESSSQDTFALREDDYVLGDRKFAGNAQSIGKDRWLHHTSFLWDYSAVNMKYLQNPAKQPKYRAQRDHSDFLCKLKDVVGSQDDLFAAFSDQLERHFDVTPVTMSPCDMVALTSRDHRKSTKWVNVVVPATSS